MQQVLQIVLEYSTKALANQLPLVGADAASISPGYLLSFAAIVCMIVFVVVFSLRKDWFTDRDLFIKANINFANTHKQGFIRTAHKNGLTILSSIPVPVGDEIKIEIQNSTQNDVTTLLGRCQQCRQLDDNSYLARINFTETETQNFLLLLKAHKI